jgi:hypothetical protein
MAAWLVLVLVLEWGERGTCRESPTCCDPSTGQTHLQEPATPKPFEDEDDDEDEDENDMPQRALLAPLLCKPGHSRRKLFLCTYATLK